MWRRTITVLRLQAEPLHVHEQRRKAQTFNLRIHAHAGAAVGAVCTHESGGAPSLLGERGDNHIHAHLRNDVGRLGRRVLGEAEPSARRIVGSDAIEGQ